MEEKCEAPEQIFLLSGQSNMAGRGGVQGNHWDHVVPPECAPDPAILRFSAAFRWVQAREPLHADIDVRKTCGVGPGMPFATALIRRLPSPPAALGLVPCAIGGTAISEWARGGLLYERMLARSRQAGAPPKAILWYQGESDTDTPARAGAYGARLERLILDVRSDLGLPRLPFIQVALASGKKAELVEVVREAQLAVNLPNVVCVDAMGLPLKPDKLHLTTDAQVSLGNMLAQAYLDNFLDQY